MIEDIEDYFTLGCGRCARFATPDCSTRRWTSGLLALRRICLGMGLEERLKWAHPCYMHAGRNICIIGAFRDDFRLSFFDAALLSDPEGLLERPGPNTPQPDMIHFGDVAQVAARAATLRAYLREAMNHAEAGIRLPKQAATFELPDDLTQALDADPTLAGAFHALTPGRQRSYVIDLSRAKKKATRLRRIAGYRDRILAGKGAQER
ncbi:YdeI/OmpD-associated family protein [Aliiroseovarius sp.]|uniref:YdeI/OmpD-associated family protein n=1 Tax=Aliiroseovarius sp. TaxID=1872442 RepID=UPI003BAAE619